LTTLSEERHLPSNDDSALDRSDSGDREGGAHFVEAGYLHVGPLPDPGTLKRYQDISPELMNSIVDAFVSQGAHRKFIERWIYKGGTIRSILGVVFAFVMGMTAILAGAYLVLQNHAVAGTIFGGFGIAGIIRSFLTGTRLFKNGTRPDDDSPA
jgi:hypothetical protein